MAKSMMEGSAGEYGIHVVKIDPSTHAVVFIPYEHYELHMGKRFLITYKATKDDTQDIEIRFKTPDTKQFKHLVISVNGTGDTDVDIYEATSFTHVSGNALTPRNRNRNYRDDSDLEICHTPAGSGDGIWLWGESFGLDTGGGATRVIVGGAAGGRDENIFRRNTAYLLRIGSNTDGNKINVHFDWYEHTDKYSQSSESSSSASSESSQSV